MWLLPVLFIFLITFPLSQSISYETNRTFTASQVPRELKGISIDEKTGKFINLDVKFKNERGQTVTLGSYFNGSKPVLFTIVYYLCPNLCQLHLNGLMEGIKDLKIKDSFEFVALSMDHRESPRLARRKKQSYIQHYNLSGKNWHFLTGIPANIKEISQQVGFKFKWNKEQKQYAHLPVAYVLTPKGQISRYLYGVEMSEKTLRLSLIEAANGRIGGLIERILLFCFQFDPRKNRYTLYAYNFMRVGAILMILILALMLIPVWFRHKKS